jgi:hypothetical protein
MKSGSLFILFNFFLLAVFGANPEKPNAEIWKLNSLKEIGGHSIQVLGNPKVVNTDFGKAIHFNGISDRVLVNHNPIGDSKEFTIEVIFKPKAAYNISQQPRFIHFQDVSDTLSGWNDAHRIMMELRLTPDNNWYLDGFLLTDAGERTLQNKNLTHPTNKWVHAALTYKNDTLRTYVNGIEELAGTVSFKNNILHKTGNVSIGGRMNRINYYCGWIKELKITQKALKPIEFLKIKM